MVPLPRHTTASGIGGSSDLQETRGLPAVSATESEQARKKETVPKVLFPPDLEGQDPTPVSHSMYTSLIVFRTVLGSRTFKVTAFVSLSTLMCKDKHNCPGKDHKVLQIAYLKQGSISQQFVPRLNFLPT